jgi:hypothetical protein
MKISVEHSEIITQGTAYHGVKEKKQNKHQRATSKSTNSIKNNVWFMYFQNQIVWFIDELVNKRDVQVETNRMRAPINCRRPVFLQALPSFDPLFHFLPIIFH